MEEKSDLSIALDQDENFKSKKRLVVILSAVLLVLIYSGAEIKEANTFIFKIDFKHQGGLGWLLAFAIGASLIRYMNYARPYTDQISNLWTKRLINRPQFFSRCPFSDSVSGYEVDMFPSTGYDTFLDHKFLYTSYKCRFPLIRSLVYEYGEQPPGENTKEVYFSLFKPRRYFNVLWLEFRERLKNLISHREFLDVFSAYFMAYFALTSFILKDNISFFLSKAGL